VENFLSTTGLIATNKGVNDGLENV